MKPTSRAKRRPVAQITLNRASRLYAMIALLGDDPQTRDDLLAKIGIGLRTFYRELQLLKRCGIRVVNLGKIYHLKTSTEEAHGKLPFPDPQLSFAEMIELTAGSGPASRRLDQLLRSVTESTATKRGRGRKGSANLGQTSRPKKS